MQQSLIFKTIFYDRQSVSGPIASFFRESDEDEKSVTEITEGAIIKWLFTHPRTRNFLVKEFFLDATNTEIRFNIEQPFTTQNQKPGDIDLLLAHPLMPHRAVAFECKRVKILSTDGKAHINNAEKIRKAVIQANGYQSLGFSQTYLMVILQDDGRHLSTPNLLMRQGKGENINRIFQMPWQISLHRNVGIVFIYVSQMSGRSIYSSGSIGICVDKRANFQEQSNDMTRKVSIVLKY